MNPEKMNFNFAEGEGVKEVIIREVNQVVEDKLPVLEPDKVAISGTISAIFAFLEKRWNADDKQIDHCRTHILVDRDNLMMTLVVNETDKREKKEVIGKISLSRQYCDFGINENDKWNPIDLGNFFRINRSYFTSIDENMTLVSQLKSFKAKVNQTVEREEKDNGGKTDVFRQVVDSSLPKAFAIKIPVFKGTAPSVINVEIIAHVHGREFELELISADAAAIVEECRDKLFDEQIDKIRELAPEIPIIEV